MNSEEYKKSLRDIRIKGTTKGFLDRVELFTSALLSIIPNEDRRGKYSSNDPYLTSFKDDFSPDIIFQCAKCSEKWSLTQIQVDRGIGDAIAEAHRLYHYCEQQVKLCLTQYRSEK